MKSASVLAQKQNVSCLSKEEAREVGRDLSKVRARPLLGLLAETGT